MQKKSPVFLIALGLFTLTACNTQTDASMALQNSVAPDGGYADVVIRDTAVYTLNEEQPWAQAVAIRGGKIVMVGSNQEAENWTGPVSRVISQPGGMVLPGFQDAHIHAFQSGVEHFQCDLHIEPYTLQNYLSKVQACADELPGDGWIIGEGWWSNAFPPSGYPTKKPLDDILPDRPVFLLSNDAHIAWANSKALEIAGITAATPDPVNGRILHDADTGEPTGAFLETPATDLIKAHVPPPLQTQLDDGMRYVIHLLHSLGITAFQDASVSIDPNDPLRELETHRRYADSGELKMHAVLSLEWDGARGLEQIPELVRASAKYDGGLLNTRTVKFWLDGIIEISTAALLQDYTDRPGFKGDLQVPPDILNEAVAQLDELGFQIHIHAIGDAAVREALDAFEFALQRNGPTNGRHHIAHVQFIAPGDVRRFAELNVTANVSPLWAQEDEAMTKLSLPHVGPERYRWSYLYNSILKSGGRIVFGSDWSTTSADPLPGIETAVTRIDPEEHNTPLFLPDERITLAQAITAATLDAAYVNHLDDRTGSIEIGKLGDLVILDTNLFEIEPSAISDAKVVATLFGGEVVYHRADL
jgi:predicted amidohydrolase YtcJ